MDARIRRWLWAACALMLALVIDAAAGTEPYTVGGDAACDYASIQDAIDAAVLAGTGDPTVIRIARSQNYTGVALDFSASWIFLTGGYDNCADDTPTGRTVLDGAGGTADSVIDIAGNAWVVLRDLAITGGDPGAGNYGGGAQILGDNSVWLENTIVHGNQSDRGGGVYIDGALNVRGFLSIDQNSSIFSNIANQSGGGIYCVDTDEFRLITLNGDIFDNQAVNGGGVYLDGCSFEQEPTKTGDGIFFNRATGSGGGVYLTNQSTLSMRGLPNALSVLSLNDASLDGGGLYVTGGSVVRAVATQVIDNFAGRDGGAVYLDGGFMTLDPGRGCTLQRCSRLESNRALGRGGAIYQPGGDIEVLGTWIMDNQAPDGSVIKTEGGTSYFESILAAGNRGATSVMRIKNTDAEIYGSTFADNEDMSATLLLTGGSLALKGSIIWESTGNALDFFGAATTTSYDCLLVHNFPVLSTTITFGDPLFVNPANDNYHLQLASPAVDYCFDVLPVANKGTPALGSGHDIEGQDRGNDVASVPNEYGPHDLGADEWIDLIFSDGYERL